MPVSVTANDSSSSSSMVWGEQQPAHWKKVALLSATTRLNSESIIQCSNTESKANRAWNSSNLMLNRQVAVSLLIPARVCPWTGRIMANYNISRQNIPLKLAGSNILISLSSNWMFKQSLERNAAALCLSLFYYFLCRIHRTWLRISPFSLSLSQWLLDLSSSESSQDETWFCMIGMKHGRVMSITSKTCLIHVQLTFILLRKSRPAFPASSSMENCERIWWTEEKPKASKFE